MSEEATEEKAPPEPTPPAYVIHSVCECQAALHAELDADRLVLRGWCSFRGEEEPAPANTVGKPGERFDVAWQCPRCGRNTLRTFYEGALEPVHEQQSDEQQSDAV
jgi:hypothetical protein